MRIQAKWFVTAIVVFALQIANCRAEVFVFGDSLSETGNFYAATGGAFPPSPLYFEGRLSNGKAWVEHFARFVREPAPTPSLLGGTNGAFNGSRAAGVSAYGTPSVTEQVAGYLAASGGTADPTDIFVIWAGANDIFFGPGFGETDFIPKAIAGIKSSIEALHAAGARRIIVLDLPPLGQTPFFSTNPPVAMQLDALTAAFNSELASMLRRLRTELRHVRIADVKISRLFQTMTLAPQLFGLQNVVDSATLFDPVSGIGYAAAPGADANRYLFWDSVHPTAQGHKIIAAFVLVDYKRNCIQY